MNQELEQAVKRAKRIVVIQAENPDGDSLGSALALEEILGDQKKEVSLYCPVNIPKYLRYANGWDRVVEDFDNKADLAIIVDTASKTLLDKALTPEVTARLSSIPVFAIDHHQTKSDLPFAHNMVSNPKAVATSEVIYDIAKSAKWKINPQAAENLLLAIFSDSLGLVTEAITAKSIRVVADLVELGAKPSDIDQRRREFTRKSPEILTYKGRLLERVEYYLEGQLALIHIPWEEIEKYSDQYNPSMLVIDEMRMVEEVRLAVAIKTYPDGKLTAKLRANPDAKIAETVASFFGGGGHVYAAGFRSYEPYKKVLSELVSAVDKALKEYDETLQHQD